MTSETCPVCQGSRRYRIPLHYDLSAVQAANYEMPPEVHESWREYDCPQCVTKAPYTRMATTKVMNWMDAHRMSEDTKHWWRANAAKHMGRQIAEKLID